jgi:hypothetical protein
MRRDAYVRLALATVVIGLLVSAKLQTSFGWGQSAQRLIANKAIDTLPDEMTQFFTANRQFIVQHVADGEEAPEAHTDFIQLDHYGQFPFTALPHSYTAASTKFTRRALVLYGVLPWQIGTLSQKMTDTMRARQWGEAKLAAAELAHYVAEAHDPFKTTMNFDGKLSDQPGVNERYDVGLIDRYQLFFFVKPNEAAFVPEPTERAFDMCIDAHSWLENVLLSDRRAHEGLEKYNDEYYDRFYAQAGAVLVRQLSDAATDVGSYWMTAWINAGRPSLPAQ